MRKHVLVQTVFYCLITLMAGAGIVSGQGTANRKAQVRENDRLDSGILLDDFESNSVKWTSNDINKQDGHGQVLLCEIFGVRPGAPGGSKDHAATVTFKRAADSWASVSTPVDGVRWQEKGVRQISFYFKGDGSENDVEVMLRGVDSSGEEKKFSTFISLKETDWRRVVLPLNQFTSHGHSADQHVPKLYLLQFVKRGSWTSLFFTIDDITAEWTTGSAGPRQPDTPPSASSSAEQVRLQVGYDEPALGPVRVSLGVNIGPGHSIFLKDKGFRESARALGAKHVRVLASQSVGLQRSKEQTVFETTRLLQLVDAIRSMGSEPLICVDRNPGWQLSESEMLDFCEQLIKSVNAPGRKPAAGWEMLNRPTLGTDAIVIDEAVALYNRLRARALHTDATVSIGGIGLPSPWKPHLGTQLDRAANMEFLTYYLYGTHNNSTSNEDLFSAARKGFSVDLPLQIGPQEVRGAIAGSVFTDQLPVYITEVAPNSVQDSGGKSLDKRLTTSYAAAWYARLMSTVALYVDAVFPYELTAPSWGLLNAEGRAYPAYYSLWIFGTYFPRGTSLYPSHSDGNAVSVLAGKTRTAHNVLLINQGEKTTVCNITVGGLKALKKVRIHLLEDGAPGIQYNELSAKPEQRVTLRQHSLAVLQFIE